MMNFRSYVPTIWVKRSREGEAAGPGNGSCGNRERDMDINGSDEMKGEQDRTWID